jgi:hypothetical protein
MKTKIQLFLILAALLTSCSVARLQTSDSVQMYPPTNFETIEVYSTDKVNKDYTIIGQVVASIEAFDEGNASVKWLKKEAAQLGADGIINLRLEIGNGGIGNAITASGIAVKYSN